MLGFGEILFLLALGVLFLGARKLPEIAKAIKGSVGAFRRDVEGTDEERPMRDVKEIGEDDVKPPGGKPK